MHIVIMFRLKLKYLIENYGIKKAFIIKLIGSNDHTFQRKMKGEIGFTDEDKRILRAKYKPLEIF